MAGERLYVISGAAAGRAIEISADDFLIGRGESGMGNLGGDPEISRQHARFRRLGTGQLLLEDLGSTNGTFVNAKRITGPIVLAPGDQVQVGHTLLRYDAPTAEPAAAQPAVAPAPIEAQAATLPLPGARPIATAPSRPGGKADNKYSRRGKILASLLALLLIAGALVGGYFYGKDKGEKTANKPESATLAAAKGAKAEGTVYIESNVAKPNGNSILAFRYYKGGELRPLQTAEYPTGGSGSADLTDSGVLDADQQIVYSKSKKLLFAVNQGSDTIAVFNRNTDGSLEPVKGSPFPSGGKAPASVGVAGDNLVVVNKAQDGVRDLTKEAPNYTTFKINKDGSLKPNGSTIEVPAGNSPTQALISPDGKTVMSSEEGGPLRAFTLASDGTLTQGPNSPQDPPDKIYPKNFDPSKKWALGLGTHPTQKLMYAQMATVAKTAVYQFGADGSLNFLSAVDNAGATLPCWTVLNRSGSRLYTSNAGNNTMSVYDTTDPLAPKQLQTLKLKKSGNPWNIQMDPSERYVFLIEPRATTEIKPGEGNEIHVLAVRGDGTLSEPTDPVPIPVELGTNPIGIAVVGLSE